MIQLELAQLEQRRAGLAGANERRQERLFDRVLLELSDDDLARYTAFLRRLRTHFTGPDVEPDDDERRVLALVERLIRADPECRPGDLLTFPPAWAISSEPAPAQLPRRSRGSKHQDVLETI